MTNVKGPLRLATLTPLYPREMDEIETATFEWLIEREIRELEAEIENVLWGDRPLPESLNEMEAFLDALKTDLDELRTVA